ncbi:hypothetical protein QJS10_CPA06g00637 [Acorus calamus]|uniref:Uncharacterized protein n=1 Tax=Acorus calamus TaxID=4465 RepID=A0AAV9EIE0_ACOCL|nr:hypothetical protein QJS10_CPA06g00637 [Acorus calamus]
MGDEVCSTVEIEAEEKQWTAMGDSDGGSDGGNVGRDKGDTSDGGQGPKPPNRDDEPPFPIPPPPPPLPAQSNPTATKGDDAFTFGGLPRPLLTTPPTTAGVSPEGLPPS